MEVILYGLGPLVVLLLALLGNRYAAPRLRQMVAVWVSVVLVGTAAWSFPGVMQGHWTAILVVLTNLVAATSAWDSVWWGQEHPNMQPRRYYLWWALFWASLITIALTHDLAIAWLAIEFSTLASGALIVEMGNRRALEAAWKYIVIASVGLAMGIIGILFVYGSLRSEGLGWQTLDYANIKLHYQTIAPIVREVATILIVCGIGTKVGLVPFHTWLPDAHSEAPSPVSGLLSGILLGLCLVTIDRFVGAAPLPTATLFSGPHLLLIFGTLSVLVGTLALLVQRDIKRLLAYSSIEQMGIMAIGFGIGTPWAQGAALLQLVFHAVIKSTLFYIGGHLSVVYDTKRMDKITDILHLHRTLALVWTVGILALAGLPPLGLAYSEWMILQALWESHLIAVLFVLSASLVLAFAALLYHLLRGLWGGLEVVVSQSTATFEATRRLDKISDGGGVHP
ncbi:hypothetical protein D2Q93_11590 [Alicyclobacillaceae bacterium I2511]|nr:hypothetical protein D2Q93_11590 [Alicyclobacillaceae bacterium I2511]